MKCKSCAGNYKTKELICPYCGQVNLLGKLWLAEKSEAEKEYEKARMEYEKRVTPYVVNRFLNRSLVLCLLAFLAMLGVLILTVLVWGVWRSSYENGGAGFATNKLESYYEAGDYLGLHAYMEEKDLISPGQYKYSQAAILGREYAYFQAAKMIFMAKSEEEKVENSNLSLLLDHAAAVCGPQIGTYSEPDPANEEMIAKMRTEVYAFLYGTLGITEEEWEPFTIADKYGTVDVYELEDVLTERKAWLAETEDGE